MRELQIVDTEELMTASIHLVVDGPSMPTVMDAAIQELYATVIGQGVEPTGPLFSYHHRRPSDTFDFEIGVTVNKAVAPAGRVQPSILPAVTVARAIYRGPYEGLSSGWQEMMGKVAEANLATSDRFWECYVKGPMEAPSSADYETELNWVIQHHVGTSS